MEFSEFSIEPEKQAGCFRSPACDSDESVSIEEMVTKALDSPQGFPSLSASVVPGDQIAIAVIGRVPAVVDVLEHVVNYLRQNGVDVQHIAVLFDEVSHSMLNSAESDDSADEVAPKSPLAEGVLADVDWRVHDLTDEQELAYLAVDVDGEPIVFARRLTDADFVIVLSEAMLESDSDRSLAHELYPIFSDEHARTRLLGEGRSQPEIDDAKKRRRLTNEAIYQLGMPFHLEVVAGGEGQPAAIVGGEMRAARDVAREACQSKWVFELPSQMELVIAELKPAEMRSSWDEIESAIRAMELAVVDDGTLVIRAELRGSSTKSNDDEHEDDDDFSIEDFQNENGSEEDDIEQARSIESILDRIHVVMLGESFDEYELEDQGFGVARASRAIANLAHKYEQCVLIHDALRCHVTITNEYASDE